MKINFNKFKAITDLFKSEEVKKEEVAVKNFYDLVLEIEDTDKNKIDDFHIMLNNYLSAGFKIKKNHKYLINCDPFEYIMKNIQSIKALEEIWLNGFDFQYKKEIQENNNLLINYAKHIKKKDTAHPLYHIEHHFKGEARLFFYLEHIANPQKINQNTICKEVIEDIRTYCSGYSTLYKSQLAMLSNLNKKAAQQQFVHTQEDLAKIFQNKKEKSETIEKTQESYSDKTLLSMVSTLKLYEHKFKPEDSVEKFMFNEILTTIVDISKKKMPEHTQESLYIHSVLHKHLPELLSDYFEIPEKIRHSYTDRNNNTPKDIFSETMQSINNKIKDTANHVFEENFVNLKVKNRVMKQI